MAADFGPAALRGVGPANVVKRTLAVSASIAPIANLEVAVVPHEHTPRLVASGDIRAWHH
jgi:hypothetical protein